ncbi:MAG TPA: acyl-CoA synthetase [Myxococcota bacterium]|nr:acyl-CoA synthetase [Myxococcota bacterium]
MAGLGFWNFAQSDPSVLALAAPDGREWTRGELFVLQNQIAHGLRAAGLQRGDAVAIAMPNCAEFMALNLACAQCGWYLVPINWHLAAGEIAYILQDSEAKAFIAHERVADTCRAAADEIGFPEAGRFAIGAVPGFRPFDALVRGQPTSLPTERAAGAVMNYTSGTTGKPKGVRRPLAPLDPDTLATLFTGFLAMFGIKAEDGNVHIVGSPLYHTAVLVFASASLNMGHPVVLMEKWTPEDSLRLIEKYRVTTSHMVPTQFHRMLALPPDVRAKYDSSSTRTMVHAAAPCPPDVKRRMLDWWGDSIYEYYAATEGGGTLVTPQEWRRYPGTVGKAWPGADIKIYDDEAKELSTGLQGTVYMRLGQADFAYHKDEEKTRKNRIGNYFTVGDVGYLNVDGYLFLCDRKIDMIISGGANIYPAEIENVLLAHPKVGDVAVFGIPNEDWGEEVKAVIEPAAGVAPGPALAAEILAFCADKLAKFKTPKTVDFLAELPRDPNGKLYKRKLRDPYWANRERAI